MIDIENIVVNNVVEALTDAFGSNAPIVYSEYVETPSEFPCVSIYEADNSTYRNTQDNSLTEHHANVMYQVNVYAADETDKKASAKSIASVVDFAMQNMKFTRTFMNQIPNQDRSIYRITLRYTAVVGESFAVGTTDVYPMYRK